MGLQLGGLATGIDTAAIVQQLMQVERRRLLTMQNTMERHKEKRTAVSDLQSKMTALKSALEALSNASQLRSFKSTSSKEDLLTAEAGPNAFEGSHQVQIKQLASPERWIHSGYQYASSYVGAGNFIVSYNDQELIITTEADTTLQDLVNRINSDPNNPGIAASILEYDDGSGNPFHLVLNGRESGSDYQISINTSNMEVHKSAALQDTSSNNAELTTRLTELKGFTKSAGDSVIDRIRITGSSHGDVNDIDATIDINRYSTVEDLLDGIEAAFGGTVRAALDEGAIVVTDKTSGASNLSIVLTLEPGAGSTASWTPPTLSLYGAEGGSITADIAGLTPATFTEIQDAQDAMLRVDGYPSGEGNWIRRSSNTIDDVISGVTLNLHAATKAIDPVADTYESVEITLNRNTEKLKEKINAMVTAYNDLVKFLGDKTKYDQEKKKSGILGSEYAVSSIESLLRQPLISNTVGFTTNDSFLNPRDIGLTVEADGTLKLDESKLDEAVVKDYAGVLALIGAQKTGTTSGPGASVIKFYQASRYTEAGSYDVKVDASGQAWIKKSNEDWSAARPATIDADGYIVGSMERDASRNPLYPEFGLHLKYEGIPGTEYVASVSIRQGFAGDLFEDVSNMLEINGRIPTIKDSIQSQIDAIDLQIVNEESRLERYEERLKAQYARLERTLQTIQQQMSGLTML